MMSKRQIDGLDEEIVELVEIVEVSWWRSMGEKQSKDILGLTAVSKVSVLKINQGEGEEK